jgi:hypothetical protein
MSICRDLSLAAVQIHQLLARTAYIRQVTWQIYYIVWTHVYRLSSRIIVIFISTVQSCAKGSRFESHHTEDATVLGSILASSDTMESEGQQMKQCKMKCLKYPKNYLINNTIYQYCTVLKLWTKLETRVSLSSSIPPPLPESIQELGQNYL